MGGVVVLFLRFLFAQFSQLLEKSYLSRKGRISRVSKPDSMQNKLLYAPCLSLIAYSRDGEPFLVAGKFRKP